MKKDHTSLFLAQSYQDAWEDYQRSLNRPSFPVWDYVFLTASDEHQAEGFRAQLASRKEMLPARTKFVVLPDEGGVRVGSGGATLSVLRALREREDRFDALRILVIHSGGDSRRVPQYSALGKLFSPVPHCLPDGRSSTLFDECMITASSVPGRIREGMLLLSGDVLLLFNPLLIDYSGRGAAVISFKEPVSTGKEHGVFVRAQNGNVGSFLHKQPEEVLRAAGAVNEAGAVDIDTGAVIFGVDVLNALYGLISTEGRLDSEKYAAFVNERVRLSLYGDFQYPMAEDSTPQQYELEKPEGTFTPELWRARRAVWDALRPFRMKLLRLAPARFIHFGTTREILGLMREDVEEFRPLGWSAQVNCAADERCAGYNSVLSPKASVGKGCYLEVSYVHSGARIGGGSVVSCVDVHEGAVIPPDVVLHGLKTENGRFVCRIFGTADNPKEGRLFGCSLEDAAGRLSIAPNSLWQDQEEHSLWNARLYPECETIREAVDCAVQLYAMLRSVQGDPAMEANASAVGMAGNESRMLMEQAQEELSENGALERWLSRPRQSLCSGFHDADPEALLAWNRRMRELVQMNHIEALIEKGSPARTAAGSLPSGLSPVQEEWLEKHLARADYSGKMRLHYYIGTALGGAPGEQHMAAAFDALRSAILQKTLDELRRNPQARIACEEHAVHLPLRVNWGGGWSDTPPYCNERGGCVLNAAILLDGQYPVSVTLRRLEEHRIILESRDMDVHGVFTDISQLQKVGDPFDPFALHKAALLTCRIIPAQGGSLEEVCSRLGGGFSMNTQVSGVPKGSGLGTSSILAAACVRALMEFTGGSCEEEELYRRVLCMEQIMSTGGGWQDQVGGARTGIKLITSRPGLIQQLKVEQVNLDPDTHRELNERFALIYTGQRRLARNLLRDVIGRYIGNEPDTLYALNEIQRKAALMRFELERGNVDAFAVLLDEHWELSKAIDAGSTNTLIEQIFASVENLVDARMVCGAGGGGFLQVILKKDVSKTMLAARLQEVFGDSDVRVWDAQLLL